MLDLTAAAEVNGQKFDGIDYFSTTYDPSASDDDSRPLRLIQSKGFDIGSLVAPVWPEPLEIQPWEPMSNRPSSWMQSKWPAG